MSIASTRSATLLWDMGALPFHIGTQKTPSNGNIPSTAPFRIGNDEAHELLIQVPDPDIERLLAQAYAVGSQIGTPMNGEGLGKRYSDDFLGFILEAIGAEPLSKLSVLEVGCGTGYLLKELQQHCGKVMGLEPGMSSPRHALDAGIEVIRDQFSKTRFQCRFDLILHYAVLEHVPDPLPFLVEQRELLNQGGAIILAVPDCTDYIRNGDLSMLLHEHWSYFTKDSLRALCASAGLNIHMLREAGVGGALYAVCTAERQTTSPANLNPTPNKQFLTLAKRSVDVLREYISAIQANGKSLGIYCPSRFFMYQSLLDLEVNKDLQTDIRDTLQSIRYFDDDPALQGLYYPPISIPVESREELLFRPVDHLLIMSRTFGPDLAKTLSQKPELAQCQIKCIDSLFSTGSNSH